MLNRRQQVVDVRRSRWRPPPSTAERKRSVAMESGRSALPRNEERRDEEPELDEEENEAEKWDERRIRSPSCIVRWNLPRSSLPGWGGGRWSNFPGSRAENDPGRDYETASSLRRGRRRRRFCRSLFVSMYIMVLTIAILSVIFERNGDRYRARKQRLYLTIRTRIFLDTV